MLFSPTARKSRLVFLPPKTAPPIRRRRDFERQTECRHNTLDFASQNRVPKGACAPFGIPLNRKMICSAFGGTYLFSVIVSTPPDYKHHCFAVSHLAAVCLICATHISDKIYANIMLTQQRYLHIMKYERRR